MEEKKVIHAAEDDDGVNMGVFFITNSPDAIRLLDLIWLYDLGSHRVNWEQGAFKELLNHHAQVRKLVSTPQSPKAFNSFPREREAICRTSQENNWTQGDFICHFSGIPSPDLERLIHHYVTEYAVKVSS